jgi:hypothetical protein
MSLISQSHTLTETCGLRHWKEHEISTSIFYNCSFRNLVSNGFSNINFYNGIIQYDFSDSFQSYGDLFEVVAVDLSIPTDSCFQKLQNRIVSKLRKRWLP